MHRLAEWHLLGHRPPWGLKLAAIRVVPWGHSGACRVVLVRIKLTLSACQQAQALCCLPTGECQCRGTLVSRVSSPTGGWGSTGGVR